MTAKRVVIIDCGLGNVGSIQNLVKKIGGQAVIASEPEAIRHAERLVLPGVGAFDVGMANLRERGWLPVLQQRVVRDQVPILGICLGMQLFTSRSEEGREPGLGWIDAQTVRFHFSPPLDHLRVPHMGWNEVVFRDGTPFSELNQLAPRFYFVHSYHVVCRDAAQELAGAQYGMPFTAAILKGNILGTQFHPEKSHRYGAEFFRRFLEFS